MICATRPCITVTFSHDVVGLNFQHDAWPHSILKERRRPRTCDAQVGPAATVTDALDVIASTDPDGVIVDINLGGKSASRPPMLWPIAASRCGWAICW
jgi:hypothetical protein